MELVKACEEDIWNIYKLLNYDYIKKYSEKSEYEEWFIHKKWYKKMIESKTTELFVLKIDKEFCGQVKFDIMGSEAIINIAIIKSKRGSGYSKFAIDQGIKLIQKNHSIKTVVAFIMEENEISIKTFKSLGFKFQKKHKLDILDMLTFVKNLVV